MRKSIAGLSCLALATGLVVGQASLANAAAPINVTATAVAPQGQAERLTTSDEFGANPLEAKRRALRETGLSAVLDGRLAAEKRGRSTVVKVGKDTAKPAAVTPANAAAAAATGQASTGADQYVELSREGTDKILVVLAEFGDRRHPSYPDKDINPATPGPVTFDGPLHNAIPKPGANDNSTVWQRDFSTAHYQELYFGTEEESLKGFYERQSSGRYSVDGQVFGWVKVPYNEARYGRSSDPLEGERGDDPAVCGDVVCSNAYVLVKDAIDTLFTSLRAKGLTTAQITAELQTYDVQDRYDYDGDGNFTESDGYVDHFQVVHAGGDESDRDPQQGEDALWAHRAYAFPPSGTAADPGPSFNKLGGTPVGDTGLFVGDYTMQPENGGVSVFAHEYGHDLGLPDHYDTAGGDNGVEWWNLMAQSRLSGKGEALGTRAGDLSAWDKLQLGWLDYETTRAGQTRTLELGPHEYNSAKAQALVTVLPKKPVVTQYGKPFSGTKQYFSGNQDDLTSSMSGTPDLRGKTSASIKAKIRYSIEADYDYLYVQYSTDGRSWNALNGTVGGKPFGEDGGGTPAITGSSAGKYVDLSVPLTPILGKKAQVRLLYRTDGGVSEGGALLDDIAVVANGQRIFFDDAEGAPKARLDGFSQVGASVTDLYDNFYIASNRSHVSYDKYLQTGPYNFGYVNTRPRFVEHFSYQQGLLVSYWDTSQRDNNTSAHPGQGLVLPIDAHPEPIFKLTGAAWRSRVQVFDAPFSLQNAASFTLHDLGVPHNIKGQRANPRFDDSTRYFRPEIPLTGVLVPNAGVTLTVTKQAGTSMTVELGYKKPAV